MRRIHRTLMILLTPLLLIGSAGGALAASNGVRDQAHFFSPKAISQAEQIIQQIQQREHKDLLIETVPEVPPEMAQQLQQQGKTAFFQGWARQRAARDGVNGIYILISRNPPHLQVVVGNKTQQGLFPMEDRDELSRRLLAAFRAKDYDQGLLQGAQFVLQKMNTNSSRGSAGAGTAPAPVYPRSTSSNSGSRGWGIGGLACILIGIVLFIILIRGVFGRSGGGYYGGGYPPGGAYPPGATPPGGGYYGGGGGFGRGFLGGLLGGALGGYAADRWLGQGQQQGGGYVPPPANNPDPTSGVDTSYTSTGGDFGGAGGAPDAGDTGGGGGFGDGGDFGGGDAGGGGDGGTSSGGDF